MANRPSVYAVVMLFCVLLAGTAPVLTARCAAAEDLFSARLDKGLSNTDPYAYVLIEKAREDRTRAKEYLLLAKKYAPDLPAVYFALSGQALSPSPGGIYECVDYLKEGISAYGRNFWWQSHAFGVLLIGFLLASVLSLCVTVAIRLPEEYRLLCHDVLEDRKRVLLLALLLFLACFGFLAFVTGLLMIFGIYFARKDKTLVYFVLAAFALSPFAMQQTRLYLTPPTPTLKAAVAVNESRDNEYALSVVGRNAEFVPAFSHALALKRTGHLRESVALYRGLIGKGNDPLVLTNLGNAYYGLREFDAAKDSYQKAIAGRSSAVANYNLSQVYRELFDFPKGDEHFLEAAKLDREAVSRFTAISSQNPNRYVIDQTLPLGAIKLFATASASLDSFPFVLGVLMIFSFYILNSQITSKAHLCKRCGAVACPRCSRTLALSGMCPQCYTFLIKVGELDAKERIARLLSMHQNQEQRRSLIKVLSCSIPGTGQIYAGAVTAGFFMLWAFLFALAVGLLCHLSFDGIAPFTQSWMSPAAVLLAGLSYAASIIHMKRGLHKKGWV